MKLSLLLHSVYFRIKKTRRRDYLRRFPDDEDVVPGVVVETHVVRLDGRVQLPGAQLVSTFSNLFSSFRHFGRGKISWSVCFAFRGEFQCHQYFMRSFFVQKFFAQLLCALQFGFVIFWRKDFGTKAAHKVLVRLTTGVC
jgi:hypothetical protein